MIKHQNVNKIILLIMVAAISALFLTMIRQFLMAIFMAGLFSAMSTPVHRWLTPRLNNRENLASTLIIIAIVCLILIPLALLISVVIGQAVHVGQSVSPWIDSFVEEPGILSEHISKIPHYETLLPYRDMILEKAGEIVAIISNLLISSLTSLSKITINALFNIVIMLYVMFYFLSMGDVLLRKILYYLPMVHEDEERLLLRFTSVAGATMKSTFIIGILQGGLCGFAFFFGRNTRGCFLGNCHGRALHYSSGRDSYHLAASPGYPCHRR
ncbi:hypothetical protein GMJAKD_02315 [Candidatus Electrothrix aarhusensis]